MTQDSATVRSFTHDAAGNITIDNRAGTNHRYYYNERGRLKQYRVGNQVRANYRYDCFERLNWRETQNMTPAGATHYIQDLSGQLIYEATATGTPLREYIWVDDMPLAVFADLDTASPQLYYVHPDHLNRPLRMTDGSKAIVWDAIYKPFGEVHSITGSATLNLRFPGQYFLLESGLAYNWHRHYDPTLGRYTRPDPIADPQSIGTLSSATNPIVAPVPDAPTGAFAVSRGTNAAPRPFQDGPSVYAYAKSAPAQNIDPEGRNAIAVPILLCLRFPRLCAATAAAAANACLQTYRFVVSGSSGSDGSDDDPCEKQVQADEAICRAQRRPDVRARCYESANARYGACRQKKPLPPLITW